VLVRVDGAGATHELLNWLEGQRVQYSVGFALPDVFSDQLTVLGKANGGKGAWEPAYDSAGGIRDGAFVADATGLLDLHSGSNPWPVGMRVIIRKERPQLRITDVDGQPGHRVRDQHQTRRTRYAECRPRATTPPPRPLRRPHPPGQRHRPA
jgi:hypothetical protein